MQLTTLRRLFLDEMQEIYVSELMVQEALPRLISGIDSKDLQKAFARHGEQTASHLKRLEQAFQQLESSPRGGRGRSVRAMLTETEDHMGEGGDAHVVDASLIAAAKRIEHWEIASYSVMATYAEAMNLPEIAALLKATLEEELAMDQRLSEIAKEVNTESQDLEQAQSPR